MSKSNMTKWMDENKAKFSDLAKQIWEHPELGYNESFASSLQIKTLEEAGFKVTSRIDDIPTAFVAEYGNGKPIIGILGEFDALPGLSQQVTPNIIQSFQMGQDMAVDTTCLEQLG